MPNDYCIYFGTTFYLAAILLFALIVMSIALTLITLILELIKILTRKDFLAYHIRKRRIEIDKYYRIRQILDLQKKLYLPTRQTIIIILSAFILLEIVFIIIKYRTGDISYEISTYTNITYVILLALVIFVAEYLRDRDETASARVLLKKTYLFPLLLLNLVFVIFQTILSILKVNTFFSVVFIIIVYISFGFAFSGLIDILSKKYSFFIERISILRDRIRYCLDPYINYRFGKEIFFRLLEGEQILFKYSPFIYDQTRFFIVRSKSEGTVSNINLKLLEKASRIIESEANRNGYTFNRQDFNKAPHNYKDGTQRFLVRQYGDIIEKGTPIVAVKSEYIKDTKVRRKVNRMIEKSIIIDKIVSQDTVSEVRFEFNKQKDQFIKAINESMSGEVENITKLYVSGLVESLFELIKEYKLNCSLKEAIAIRGSFARLFSKNDIWFEIEWIWNDLRDVLNHGLRSSNKDIISHIGYIPVMVSRRAIEINDFYFFLQFMQLHELLYEASIKQNDMELEKFMVDRAWRYLKEMADYYIERELTEMETGIERLKTLKDYAISVLAVFQNMIRTASQKNEYETYLFFISKASQLFRRFNPASDQMNVKHINTILNLGRLSDSERRTLIDLREKQQLREDISVEIKSRRSVMFFGLAAFTLDENC